MGGVLFALFAFSVNLSAQSYRNLTTGGMFKEEIDRISDNPAYIGAKLDGKIYIEYEKSITKEKTNIYTGMNGINDNNSYLLGGSTRMNSFGIAGLLELGLNTTPNAINSTDISVNNTEVVFSSARYGKDEGNNTYYADTDGDDIFDSKESLNASKKDYTKDKYFNGIIGLGGFNAGGMTLGFSIDATPVSSSVTEENYTYDYSRTNLLNSLVDMTQNQDYKGKVSEETTDYTLKLGVIMPMGENPLEAVLMFSLNSYENLDNNGTSTTTVNNSVAAQNINSSAKDTSKGNGYTFGLLLQTRMNLADFNAQPYIQVSRTSMSNDNTGDDYSTSYTENLDAVNTGAVDRSSTYDGSKIKGKGFSETSFTIGSNFRKALTTDLLVGFGAQYTFVMSKNKYKDNYSYRQFTEIVQNDGDIIGDYTRLITSSFADTTEEKVTMHNVVLPIGIEYTTIPALTLRLGYIFRGTASLTDLNVKRSDVVAQYTDYDYANVPGNETNSDTLVNTDSEDLSVHRSQEVFTMTNTYTVGFGYSLAERVQLDLAFGATGSSSDFNEIDSASFLVSATFVY